MTEPPIRRVSARVLRQIFNEGQCWEQIQQGLLQPILRADKHPSSPRASEPICTRSQYIIYVNTDGQKVAEVHQYLRADGSIGASGRPDPKLLMVDGVIYILDTTAIEIDKTSG